MKQDEGMIHKILSLGLMLFIILCYVLLLEMRKVSFFKSQLEDALVQANLAAAIVDVYEYGTSEEIVFLSPQDSFLLIEEFLEVDLQSTNLSVEEVEIVLLDCRFYEVEETQVVEYVFDEEGVLSLRQHSSIENMNTPNESVIETSTIYSKIGVWFEVLKLLPVYIEMEQSVDIARNA
ncbi:MAG: hypothetical protein R3Y47_08790 [Lachnospiraceae bacterium]